MLISLIPSRVYEAILHRPHLKDWVDAALLLGVYATLALPWGFKVGLLCWQPVRSLATISSTVVISFFLPSVLEELLFRVWLLPDPQSPHFYLWAAGGLILFILAHPLNALLVLPHRKATFFNGHFLALAGLLGVLCTLSYQYSGSLWPPVILHWLIVILWLLLWGGLARMLPPTAHPSAE